MAALPARLRRRSRLLWREALDGYLFTLPWLLGFLLFVLGPMIASLVLSLFSWEIITPPKWYGLGNFEKMLGDRLFWTSLYNTAYMTFVGVPLNLGMALLVALALNQNLRGIYLYRVAYYLPSQTPLVASALLWMWMFNPDFGIINAFLGWFGVPPQRWLWDPQLSKPSLIMIGLWGFGTAMIVFLSGLQSIAESLYEAAAIDGAGTWQRFVHITLPMLSPVIFFNLIIGMINNFQGYFTLVFMTTGGGPADSTLVYVIYLYRNAFEWFRMGYASAMAWVLFGIVLLFTGLQFLLARRWVFYESDLKKW